MNERIRLSQACSDKIYSYCKLNDITDIDGFVDQLISKSLTEEIYGDILNILNNKETQTKEEITSNTNKANHAEEEPKTEDKTVEGKVMQEESKKEIEQTQPSKKIKITRK